MAVMAQAERESLAIRWLASRASDPGHVDAFLRSVWRYENDPEGVEYVASPELQVKRAVGAAMHSGAFALWGDCDEAATLAGSLMLYFGVPSSLVAIRQAGRAEFSHVFLRWAGGDVDPTVPASLLPISNYEESIELPL